MCLRRIGRGGRAVDGSGLENRQGASPRGFESHPLRARKASSKRSRGRSDNIVVRMKGFERRSKGWAGHAEDKKASTEESSICYQYLDYVTRRFNAPLAELQSSWG